MRLKKQLCMLSLVAFASFGITGCFAGDMASTINDQVSSTDAPTDVPAPTATPGPKETVLALKKKGTAGDWEMCVNKMSVTKRINDGKYRYFKPNKGKVYVAFSMSVKNKGKKAATFLPRLGMKDEMIQGRLRDEKGKEYDMVQLIGYSKDLVYESVKPSEKKKGIITFEIPKKMAKKAKSMTLELGTSEEKLVYNKLK